MASFASPVNSLRLVSAGGTLVVAASSGGSTYLSEWSQIQLKWLAFGPVLPGTLLGLAADPLEVAVVTQPSASALNVSRVSTTGSVETQATISTTGTNSTGIVSAGVALIPFGVGYLASVVYSLNLTDQLRCSSAAPGHNFGPSSAFDSFDPLPAATSDTSVGQTLPTAGGGIPGQVALASAGSELVALYTTYVSGQVVPLVVSSGNDGATWNGPYLTGHVNGSALNPSLTVGPDGLVYATWEDPDWGQGAIDQATYAADGAPLAPPETISSPVQDNITPSGAPAIAVDSYARPLVLWPAVGVGVPGAIGYTGGYLPPNQTLSLLQSVLNRSLGVWDFENPVGGLPSLTAFLSNSTREIQLANSSLVAGNLCAAQNITGVYLYQNLTHNPLTITGGGGASCSTSLNPSLTESPILPSAGIDAPSTYLAVYLDWALQSEGVPVATSPLSGVTNFAPYASAIPSASLPAKSSGSVSVSGSTESITVSPTPYSPSAYQLAVAATLPIWHSYQGTKCFMSNGGWGTFRVAYTTAVTKTYENVSLFNGTVHHFNGTTSYQSPWIYNLYAYQGYYWSSTFYATTTEWETTSDSCTGQTTNTTVSPITLGPSAIPATTLAGTFSTALSITPGSSFVTATFNSNHTAAKLAVQFNNTLPSTTQGGLSNSSGTQSWSTATPAINGVYALSKYSGVNLPYTLTVSSTSRVGTSTSPGSPSLAYSSSGTSTAEQASASCSFTLSSAVPSVSISNVTGAPYTSIDATTVNVTWNSTANDLGFFTYHEVGSPVNWTITGVVPTLSSSGNWVYSLELHGLEPLVAYNATLGVSWSSGCLVEEDQMITPNLKTSYDPTFETDPKLPYVWETDLPYDSLNQSGGGLAIGWDTPSNSVLGGFGSHNLLGGYVSFWNGTAQFTVPFNASQVQTNVTSPLGSNNSTNLLNLTTAMPPLGLDRTYSYEVVANYSCTRLVKGSYVNTNEMAWLTRSFTYQQSTSSDGLTDVEKTNGWIVPLKHGSILGGTSIPACTKSGTTSVPAACQTVTAARVRANPSAYGTNHLVSDLVEKAFQLDPNTIDTAGSHMLDTWNLTFDVGPASSSKTTSAVGNLSAYFHLSYENSTYSFTPSSTTDWTNLTCLLKGYLCKGEKWLGDSSPLAGTILWANTTLWSHKSAAHTLESLIQKDGVGWLRAVTGSYGNERILTVWGKLSWKLNPDVTSTQNLTYPDASGPSVPISDGALIDPRGPVVLQVNLSSWNTNNTLLDPTVTGDTVLDGVAPCVVILANVTAYPGYNNDPTCGSNNRTTNVTGGEANASYAGWGPEAYPENCGSGSGSGWYDYCDTSFTNGDYTLSVPLVSTTPTAWWRLDLYENNTGTPQLVATTQWQSVNLLGETSSTPYYTSSLDLVSKGDPQQGACGSCWSFSGRLHYTLIALPPQGKANTLLVVPANGSTLSNTPWGYRHYVGETAFDLLAVNLQSNSPITVSGFTNASGGPAYNVTLVPGLNNILVPRGIFVNSPLGEALQAPSSVNLQVTSPVLGGTPVASPFDPSYWGFRIQENNTSLRTRVWDFSNIGCQQAANCSSTQPDGWASLPLHPTLEGNHTGRELGSVFTVNISSSQDDACAGYNSCLLGTYAAQWELQQLVSGLALTFSRNYSNTALAVPKVNNTTVVNNSVNNTTNAGAKNGNWSVVNNVLNFTGQLNVLGFSPDIVRVLANSAVQNNGSYSPPDCGGCQSSSSGYSPRSGTDFGSHPSSWGGDAWSIASMLWNTATGFAAWVVSGVTRVASIVWSAIAAAATYIAGAIAGILKTAAHGLAELANQGIAALEKVGSAILWALEQAGEAIAKALVKALLDPLINLAKTYGLSLGTDLQNANSGHFWRDYSGRFFVLLVGLATALTVAFNILEALTMGTTEIIVLLVSLVVSGVTMYFLSQQGDFNAIGPYSQGLVTELGSLLGVSYSSGGQAPANQNALASALYGDLKNLSFVFGAVSYTWAVALVSGAFPNYKPDWTDNAALALAVAALALAAVGANATGAAQVELDFISVEFDADSLVLDGISLAGPGKTQVEDYVTLGMDIAAGATDGAVLYGDYAHW